MSAVSSTRIFILNYNGLELMKECLPSIVDAANASRRKVAITVIDNVSTDDSVNFLRKNFSQVAIYESPKNKILCSYNDAVANIEEDVVIFLNNDIKVDKYFVDPLLDPFEEDDSIFSVGSKCLDFDGSGFQGEKSVGGFRGGMFWTDSRYSGYEKDVEQPSWTLQVALGAFHRKKFLELGGYDNLYLPGTWEDTDISWRAYRKGWHCVYEPRSVIYHKGQATFHKVHGVKGSSIIASRNSFLFIWKNFSGSILAAHFIFLPLRLLRALFRGDEAFLRGFFRALARIPLAIQKRPLREPNQKRSDKEILEVIKTPKILAKSLSAILITKNEERNIAECLERLRFAQEIIVIDSGSDDKTREIARQFTPHVFQRDFDNFAAQKNYAIEQATGEWIFSVDADERVTEELREEIQNAIKNGNGAAAYRVPRKTFFLGKKMRFSGMQDDKPVRLFQRLKGRFRQPIHEYVAVEGKVETLQANLLHHTTRTIQEEIQKTDFYTNLEATFAHEKKSGSEKFAWLPFKSVWVYFYYYLLKLGFLDGKEGFLFAYYAACYAHVKSVKINQRSETQQLEKIIKDQFDKDGMRLPDWIDRNDSRLKALLDAAGPVRGKKILDVGCGKGRFAKVMLEHQAKVFGVEPSQTLINETRAIPSAFFAQSTATALPFRDRTFDVVYAVEVIEHLPALEPSLAEMKRVLKKGGKVILIDRNIFSISQKRFLAPNMLIKKWHEWKNDWFYPRNFPFREKWFAKNKVLEKMRALNLDSSAIHVQSDGEKTCAWHALFDKIPFLRLFILWQGIRKD